MSGLLEQIQVDCEERLKADPWFGDLAIIEQRKGVTLDELKQRLSVGLGRGGKVGACILVLMPGGGPQDQTPGPRLYLVQSFIVLVHPELNSRSTGTGKSAEEIAYRILQLFNFAHLGYGAVLESESDALVPTDSFDGLVGYQVNLHTAAGEVPLSRVITPSISAPGTAAPQTITITTATAGAAIWYTTDGSYPSSANANAHAYGAPFTQATAATVRAAAEKSGLQQSNVTQLILS